MCASATSLEKTSWRAYCFKVFSATARLIASGLLADILLFSLFFEYMSCSMSYFGIPKAVCFSSFALYPLSKSSLSASSRISDVDILFRPEAKTRDSTTLAISWAISLDKSASFSNAIAIFLLSHGNESSLLTWSTINAASVVFLFFVVCFLTRSDLRILALFSRYNI